MKIIFLTSIHYYVKPKLQKTSLKFEVTSEIFKRYNLGSLNINFQKNYLIISAGREIVKISYKRISKFTGPFSDDYEAVIELKDEFHPNRMYYYITEHVPCRVDVSAPQLYIEGRKFSLKELITP